MPELAETSFVVGESSFNVHVDKTVEHRSALLTITQVEGAREWQFQIPGWQPPGLGVFNDRGYIWSARALILLPIAAHGDPEVVAIDEDILRVFGTDGGWVLSAKLHCDSSATVAKPSASSSSRSFPPRRCRAECSRWCQMSLAPSGFRGATETNSRSYPNSEQRNRSNERTWSCLRGRRVRIGWPATRVPRSPTISRRPRASMS
jgi:hypothetical protein